ncbi:MAG: GNAT family N-acetyltransferase [Shimia sp.]
MDALDRYFHRQAGQDMRRRMAVCVVATETGTEAIAGFYTLAAADIPVADVPEALMKRLPRYPTLPAARLGRLAIDERFRGRGLGAALLADAAGRAARAEIAVHAMVVDAKDGAAEAFYRHHGFETYGSAPNTLIAPLRRLLAS